MLREAFSVFPYRPSFQLIAAFLDGRDEKALISWIVVVGLHKNGCVGRTGALVSSKCLYGLLFCWASAACDSDKTWGPCAE